MAQSSLQSLFFWDCFASLLMAYLLAEEYELNISFDSYHDDDVRYKIVIINQRENQSCVHDMANELKTEYLEPVPFNGSRINHTLTIEKGTLLNYNVAAVCVLVTPFKENCSDCSNFTQIIPYVKINAYGDPDCADWTIPCQSRLQEYNESSNSWNLHLECVLEKPHDKCNYIYEFQARLKKLVSQTDDCNRFQPDSPENQLSPRIFGSRFRYLFTNLKPGFYCCVITFLSCNLYPPARCKRHTPVTHILDVKPSLLPKTEDPIEENYVWISIMVVCVVVLGLVIGGILYYRRVRRFQHSSFANDRNLSLESSRASFLSSVRSNGVCKPKREVTILYTQEIPEIIDSIIALVHFLRTCCDVIIRLDIEEDAVVRKNPSAYYNRGDLFILVETSGAVLREQACLDNKVIYHVDEDALDSYFLHSLVRIVNNPESIVDYTKYLVVHFSFTPTNVSFKTVALTKRYEIVRHLAQLRHFLNKGKDLIPSTQNLLRFSEQFEESTEYKALIAAIDRATRFISNNPNYTRNVFQEQL